MSLNLDKSRWKRVRFGDVVRNVNDSVRDPADAGIDRVIAMEHMEPGELTIERWSTLEKGTSFSRKVTPGQTLFGKRRAYQRKVAFAEFDAICSGDILTFEADEAAMLTELLPFLVQSEAFFDHALGTSAGSLSPRTNWRDLAKFEFDLPLLEEQKRIADLLWSVERHRRSAVMTASAAANTKAVLLESRLQRGVKEHGWTKQSVSDLVTSGPTNGKSARANDEERGMPTLSIGAVRDGAVRGGDSVKWVDIDPQAVKAFELQQSDFLVVRGNGNRSLTARGGLVCGGLPPGCIYPDLLIRLRFDEKRILPKFAAEQWNSEFAHADLICNAKSTNGIWKINGKDIKSHQLAVPPISEQQKLLGQLATLNDARDAADTESQSLDSLKLSLLDQIFGGS